MRAQYSNRLDSNVFDQIKVTIPQGQTPEQANIRKIRGDLSDPGYVIEYLMF